MDAAIQLLENAFAHVPLSLLEIWGRAAYLIGFVLMMLAFGGFTLKPGGQWGLGFRQQSWDFKTLLSSIITFVLIFLTGYIGSFIVLVPGAQTFESLKDLTVFLCLVLFGYPALLVVPFAYGLSDLIEGVPPDFLRDWLVGYFINPACFWLATQFIGKNPDFKKAVTWRWYLLFVFIFMSMEPILWGYICSGKFTSEISYRSITPALFFTTALTWVVAPFATLVALPLVKRAGLFWAEIPHHTRERSIRSQKWIWESGHPGINATTQTASGLPIRFYVVTPFICLILVMVALTAYFSLNSTDRSAKKMAHEIQEEAALNLQTQIELSFFSTYFSSQPFSTQNPRKQLHELLSQSNIASLGRAYIIDSSGNYIASSTDKIKDEFETKTTQALLSSIGSLKNLTESHFFEFFIITKKPLSRETWLARAVPLQNEFGSPQILITAIPESYYLEGIRVGNSRSALIFAIALLTSLVIAGILAAVVTAPIDGLMHATQALARGDLSQRAPISRLEELNELSCSFNTMATRLEKTFTDLKNAEHALTTSRDEALRAANVKSEFLANMSHEIRTPLNAILGISNLLAGTSLNEEQKQLVHILERSGDHLMTLLNDILDLTMLESKNVTLTCEQLDLHELVLTVLNLLTPQAQKKGLRLTAHIAPDVHTKLIADSLHLRQILINLMSNAIKFTDQGEVKLQIQRNPANPTPGSLSFSVIDTGIGISEAQQKIIFERFTQGNSSVNKKYGGSGLGLCISRYLVELMGGSLRVESIPGQGSHFFFDLKLETHESETTAIAPAEIPIDPRPLKILVVDDSEDNRLLMQLYLKSTNYSLDFAENGQIALEKFQQQHYDLILMDIQMPVLDGYSTTKAIRALETQRHLQPTPIVAVTAYALKEEEKKSLDAGCNFHLSKPIRNKILFETIFKASGNPFTPASA